MNRARKFFWQMMVSLDGYMEGPAGELDWHTGGDDFDCYVQAMLASIDTIVFGRRTYEVLGSYWPTATRPEAAAMNALPKVVFSHSRPTLAWSNSRLAGTDVASEITTLKQQPGRDIALFGSANLAAGLDRLGLIDEYRFLINPLVLGSGHPAFVGGAPRRALRLTDSRPLDSGVILLTYVPA
jgi:dihydrofolate reductase